MSTKAIVWARDQRLPAPQKVVLLVLASHHNPKDAKCYPSQDLLSIETGLSRRAVQMALKALEESGHIGVTKSREHGKWAKSSYALRMAQPTPGKPTRQAHVVRMDQAHVVRSDHSKKTAHGENGNQAHEMRTKGLITTQGENSPTNIVKIVGRIS